MALSSFFRQFSSAPAAVLAILSICSFLLACQSASEAADNPTPTPSGTASLPQKTDAVPLAKPHRKLGPLLASMKRETTLIEEAKTAGLSPTAEGLLVQVAYEGEGDDLEPALNALGLVILHHYPRYQRLDVVVKDYAELDALTGIGSVFRVQALPTAITR